MDESGITVLHTLVLNGDVEKLATLQLSTIDLNQIDRNGCTPLHLACRDNHTQIIKILIHSGADINAKDNNLTTPLHWCSNHGNFEIVQLLIDKGVDWQSADKNGIQPIHLAALRCHTEIVKHFLSLKINGDLKDNSGITPLHLATYAGCKNTIEAILESGFFGTNVTDNMKVTALNLAAACAYPKILKLLLDNDGEPSLADKYCNYPIRWAAINGDLETVKYLMADRFTWVVNDSDNYTPLFLATLFAHEDVIVHCLEIGHHLNLDDGDCETYSLLENADGPDELINKNLDRLETLPNVLHWAVAFCSLNVVQKLISNFELEELGRTHNTPLHTAAAFGNISVVQYLIERGADIDAKDQDECTPLHWAIGHDHYDIVKLLLDKGADKTFALHWAAATGHVDSAKLLLESGCNILEPDDDNEYARTPIQWAATCGHSEIFKFLLDNGADMNDDDLFHWFAVNGNLDMMQLMLDRGLDVDTIDLCYNRTALHWAALAGQYEACKFLVDHNTMINPIEDQGDLPIHYAVQSNNVEIVKLLIEKGADLNEHGDIGLPLCLAARENKFEVLKALVEGGVDLNLPDYNDESPLIIAMTSEHRHIVDYLLEKGADRAGLIHTIAEFSELSSLEHIINSGENINSTDSYGNTPLFYAVKRNIINTKYLVEHGAKVNHKNKSGETALINAINYENVEAIEYLFEHGAEVNYQNNTNGDTPLIHAIGRSLLDITMLLVNHGADLELCDGRYGERPIHHAWGSQRLKILKFLLSKNVNVNVLDNENKTPLHEAARNDCIESLSLLLKRDVDVNVVSKLGNTALSFAVAHKQYENCKLLLLHGADPHLDPNILIECCIKTGCLKTLKLLHLSGLRLSQVKDPRNEEGFTTAKEEIKDYLKKIETSLFTLKELCRIACKKAFGRKYQSVISQEYLPQALKQYLSFANLH